MRVFQKCLEDASSRLIASENTRNNWANPTDVSQVSELLEELQVCKHLTCSKFHVMHIYNSIVFDEFI